MHVYFAFCYYSIYYSRKLKKLCVRTHVRAHVLNGIELGTLFKPVEFGVHGMEL